MSKAFYRKYRSKSLAEVVGQDHITEVLERAINQGKIAHAYLFTGPRGVGKTSIARILAHEINALPYEEETNHPDIIEIDAASNNSVEDIRELRERIEVAPFSAQYRVYIIDEVHMLSKSAFNALLKTLEEPPKHAVFILATTDAHKLPATIISRTQQFVFHLIEEDKIIEHLRFISNQEGIKISDQALQLIAEKGGGSFRDSISLLDQISSISNEEISAEKIEQILGLAPKKTISDLIEFYEAQNIGEILRVVENLRMSGADLRGFVEQFLSETKRLLSAKPHLIRLISPLMKIKNSPFLETELLTILIDLPENFVIAPAIISAPQQNNFNTHSTPNERALNEISKGIENKTDTAENKIPPVSMPDQTPETAPLPQAKKADDPDKQPEAEPSTKPNASKQSDGSLDWTAFIRKVKEKGAGAGAILSRSEHKIEGGILKIYTGAKIKKAQLEKAQNRSLMSEALAEIGAEHWQMEIFAENKPFDDPTLAAVSAIMGGGVEVNPNE
ncbi:MAG: DNA polymerase III subunit gamma/tau [bacterium]|nr:DNA polymerase III subunit gamma/tau [bacterium]